MIDYKIIGRRIKAARTKNKMTQETLAEKLGMSAEYCSKIECGKVKVNLQRLSQISSILNEPIEFLIAGTVVESKDYLRDELANVINSLSSEKVEAIFKIANIVADI